MGRINKIEHIFKTYKDVEVNTRMDSNNGIVLSKTFRVLQNEWSVKDRLLNMCLKYDLRYWNYGFDRGKPSYFCCLRSFDGVTQLAEYIKKKSNGKQYSFKIKGEFVLATIGSNKYVYRLSSNKLN